MLETYMNHISLYINVYATYMSDICEMLKPYMVHAWCIYESNRFHICFVYALHMLNIYESYMSDIGKHCNK